MTSDLLLVIVVWILGATIVAWIASSQGRSPLTWFSVSVALSPLFGFVAVILTAPRRT